MSFEEKIKSRVVEYVKNNLAGEDGLDENGNVIHSKGAIYEVFSDFDEHNRLKRERAWSQGKVINDKTITYEDPVEENPKTEKISKNGGKVNVVLKYNDNGDVIKNEKTEEDGKHTLYEYDDKGNVTHYKTSNPNNIYEYEEWYERDDRGNVTYFKRSNGYERWMEFDDEGTMVYDASRTVKYGDFIHFKDLLPEDKTPIEIHLDYR